MKQDFKFNMNRVSPNVYLLNVYVIQNKNGIMLNVGVIVKN